MRRGIATVFGITVAEWHGRMAPRAGSRDLAEMELVPEPCESS